MRLLLLIGWIGPAVVALAVAPASAQVVRCEDASGKAVYRNANDCAKGKVRGEVVRVDSLPPAQPGVPAAQYDAMRGAAPVVAKPVKKIGYVECKAAGGTVETCKQYLSPESQKSLAKHQEMLDRDLKSFQETMRKLGPAKPAVGVPMR